MYVTLQRHERARPGLPEGQGRHLLLTVFVGLSCLVLAGCEAPPAVAASVDVFYAPLPQTPRFQFLRSLSSSDDVQEQSSGFAAFVVGEDPREGPQRLWRPYGVMLWRGKLYVCDTGARRTVIMDLEQRDFRRIAVEGNYQLGTPVSYGPQGEKYITDITQGQGAGPRRARSRRTVYHTAGRDEPLRRSLARRGAVRR